MPTFVYQVSGEYSMIMAAARQRLDRRACRGTRVAGVDQARRRRRHSDLFRQARRGVAVAVSTQRRRTPDQYGVVGHPVAHSWSPFIHGMFAKATAQNLVYRLFDMVPGQFPPRRPAAVRGRHPRTERHAAPQAGGGRTGERTYAARRARAGREHHRLFRGHHPARRQHRRRRADVRSRAQYGTGARRQARC